MKRLEIGDEVYVRNGAGHLFKAVAEKIYVGGMIVRIPSKSNITQRLSSSYHHMDKYRTHCWSLVYPFPCIKELAR